VATTWQARRAGISQPRVKPWGNQAPHPTFGHPLPVGERAGVRGAEFAHPPRCGGLSYGAPSGLETI
jgi:hypothetical protein